MASRFERACSAKLSGRIRVTPTVRRSGLELDVGVVGEDPACSLTVAGLDSGSWSDPEGVSALAGVVGILLEGSELSEPAATVDVSSATRRHHPLAAARPGRLAGGAGSWGYDGSTANL